MIFKHYLSFIFILLVTIISACGGENSKSGSSLPSSFTVVDDKLFFTAFENSHLSPRQLWISDGTESGTVKLKDGININPNNWNTEFESIGSTVFFSAKNDQGSNSLWKSDGTVAGTTMVSGNETDYDMIKATGDTLYFYIDNDDDSGELWKTDGTETGTIRIKKFIQNQHIRSMTAAGRTLFIMFKSIENNSPFDETSELWISDGTEAGTVLVKELMKNSRNIKSVGNNLYFSVPDGKSSYNWLWKSDGTTNGTTVLKPDIIDSYGNITSLSSPYIIESIDETAYFFVESSLWKSDGTNAGTLEVKDLSIDETIDPDNLIAANNILYFSVIDDRYDERQLWKSDGTEAGTLSLPFSPPARLSYAEMVPLGVIDNILYFKHIHNFNYDLWKSDDTEEGTTLVKPIKTNSKTATSFFTNAKAVVGDKIFFSASEGDNGEELWVTDGTTKGTRMVKDINLDPVDPFEDY